MGFPTVVLFVSLISIMGLGFAADSARPPVVTDFDSLGSYEAGARLELRGVLVGAQHGRLWLADGSGNVVPVYAGSVSGEAGPLDLVAVRGTLMVGEGGPFLSCGSSASVSRISEFSPPTMGVDDMVTDNHSGVIRAVGMVHSIIYRGPDPCGVRLEENGTVVEGHFIDFTRALRPGSVVSLVGVYDQRSGIMRVFSDRHISVLNETFGSMPVNLYNLIQRPDIWLGRDITVRGLIRYGGSGFTAVSPEGSGFGYSLKVRLHSPIWLYRGDLVELSAFRFSYSTRHGYYYLEEMPLSCVGVLERSPVWNLTLQELMEDVVSYEGSLVNTTGYYWCRNGVASIYSGDYSLLLESNLTFPERTPIAVRGVLVYEPHRGAYVLSAGDAVWPLH